MKILPELHQHHKLPIYHLENLDEFHPDEDHGTRIYQISIGDGMLLGFVVNAMHANNQVLRVTTHGAKGAQKGFLFNRFASAVQSKQPFVIFADPTLTLDQGNLLAWYVGTPTVNPDDWMEPIVRKMLATTAAQSFQYLPAPLAVASYRCD